MSKEYLEALEELKHWKETNNENGVVWLPLFAVEDIENALLELKAIKEAKPSEALENLIETIRMFGENQIGLDKFEERYKIIKQALLKSQEQEKVLEIIKTKRVIIAWFEDTYLTLNEYNAKCEFGYELTEEEFELLKAYFEKNIQK